MKHIRLIHNRKQLFDPPAELFQGDCLSVLRGVDDESIDAIIVDPPYGINYRSKYGQTISNDLRPFIWWLYDAFRVAKPGARLICFSAWKFQEVFKVAIETAGWRIRSHVIWDKEIHGGGDCAREFAPRHEVIWYATKGDYKFKHGRPVSVLQRRYLFGHQRHHPNEKPVELFDRLVNAITSEGEGNNILDSYGKICDTLRYGKPSTIPDDLAGCNSILQRSR